MCFAALYRRVWCIEFCAVGRQPKLDKGHHSIHAAETIQDHSSAGIGILEYLREYFSNTEKISWEKIVVTKEIKIAPNKYKSLLLKF